MKSKTLALALLTAAPALAGPTGLIEVGRPVPALVLPDLETGRPDSLRNRLGRRYVLHVFASW